MQFVKKNDVQELIVQKFSQIDGLTGSIEDTSHVQKVNVLRLSWPQWDLFEVSTLRTLNTTIDLWKMSIQSPAKCKIHGVIRYFVWKEKTLVEVKDDKAMNRSSVVTSLKMVVHLCMMIRGAEDLELTDKIVKKIENALRDNRLFFQVWGSLTKLKSQTRYPRLKVSPGGRVLRIFTSWKNPSTSTRFESANLGSWSVFIDAIYNLKIWLILTWLPNVILIYLSF